MQESLLKPFSMGIVAEDRVRGNPVIKITPTEVVPFYDGTVNPSPTNVEHAGVDSHGNKYNVKVTADNVIEATWLNFANSNRVTPPDVVVGERVLIWRYGNVDKYYWHSLGMDDGLRTLETVVFRISDIKDKKVTDVTAANSYTLTMSTHDKEINITTVKTDGEPYAYQIRLDTKAGNLLVKDDDGNSILLDSKATKIRLENKSNSFLDITKNIITMQSDSEINMKTKTMNVEATTINVKANDTNITSKVHQKGDVDVKGKVDITGNTSVTGNTSLTGPVVMSGTVMSNGHDISGTHMHKATKPGSPTDVSGPPV